jgi:hypothetical protein
LRRLVLGAQALDLTHRFAKQGLVWVVGRAHVEDSSQRFQYSLSPRGGRGSKI